jgi:hypothetical protein
MVLRRRRPKTPLMAASPGLEAEPASDVDALLKGIDLDAELLTLLTQADGRDEEAVAEPDRDSILVPTPN